MSHTPLLDRFTRYPMRANYDQFLDEAKALLNPQNEIKECWPKVLTAPLIHELRKIIDAGDIECLRKIHDAFLARCEKIMLQLHTVPPSEDETNRRVKSACDMLTRGGRRLLEAALRMMLEQSFQKTQEDEAATPGDPLLEAERVLRSDSLRMVAFPAAIVSSSADSTTTGNVLWFVAEWYESGNQQCKMHPLADNDNKFDTTFKQGVEAACQAVRQEMKGAGPSWTILWRYWKWEGVAGSGDVGDGMITGGSASGAMTLAFMRLANESALDPRIIVFSEARTIYNHNNKTTLHQVDSVKEKTRAVLAWNEPANRDQKLRRLPMLDKIVLVDDEAGFLIAREELNQQHKVRVVNL